MRHLLAADRLVRRRMGTQGDRSLGKRPRPPPSRTGTKDRTVTALLGLAALLCSGLLAAIGVRLHRVLIQVSKQLALIAERPDRDLDALWDDVQRLQAEQLGATETRLIGVDAELAVIRRDQAEMARYVRWMAPLVQRWAGVSSEAGR